MFNPSDVTAGIVVLAAAISWFNYRYVHLPHTIGLTVLGICAALAVVGFDHLFPAYNLHSDLKNFLDHVDFNRALMNGMLSFLLFAGALQIDVGELKQGRRAVLILSIAGVLISTALVGYFLHVTAGLMEVNLPLAWCLVFGALISPTDPVAVMAILRKVGVPLALETRVAGESLFNDGVGVVVFSIACAAAVSHEDVSAVDALEMFAISAIGGGIFGYLLGWIAYRSLRVVNDAPIETLITVALVMGGYSVAEHLRISSVIAMAVAGVVVAKYGMPKGMSRKSRDYVLVFWQAIDEILNSVLFVLIGLEVIAVLGALSYIWIALAAVPLVLVARAVSVALPMAIVSIFYPVKWRSFGIYVWGGLRGGIPIALALSLPHNNYAEILLMITYVVVVFSVVAQGGTLVFLARRLYPGLDPCDQNDDLISQKEYPSE
jgi:CPA1 family monovalent cation:H+ antiporter